MAKRELSLYSNCIGNHALSRVMHNEAACRDIHLWALRLDGSQCAVAACGSVLSAEERARAARFRFEQLRREFTIAHGVLRFVLAKYLNTFPAAIRFRYGLKDKPEIESPATDLHFNMSHSHGVALYAMTSDLELGVDIEQIRLQDDFAEIAGRFFCREEAVELAQAPVESAARAFFACWTRKEAYIKAVGDGLSLPLDSFRVTLLPGDPARFVHLGNDPHAANEWSLHNLDLVPGYAAALAYCGAPRKLRPQLLGDADETLRMQRVELVPKPPFFTS